MNALSLFANIGVAEAYLKDIGINVVLANEKSDKRADLYSKIYPSTEMICGDVTEQKTKTEIVRKSIEKKVDVIIATPPCQGMSTAGQKDEDDIRNLLICHALEIMNRVNPKYILIENVPSFPGTKIVKYHNRIFISDLINYELENKYNIYKYIINTQDYGIPQMRERSIILLTRKDQIYQWNMPKKEKKIVTMRDAIGHLPPIDPYVRDISEDERNRMFPKYEERRVQALSISPWHIPPQHVKRQVVVMQHTPTGCSAFDNETYYPIKENGERVKGYHNTYSRQKWDCPAYTVTMDNGKISSQNNVHPGRMEGKDENGNAIYSDARVLTLYELMLIMSLPTDWPIPNHVSLPFIRQIIGEGIPPLFVKKTFEMIPAEVRFGE